MYRKIAYIYTMMTQHKIQKGKKKYTLYMPGHDEVAFSTNKVRIDAFVALFDIIPEEI